MSARVLYLLRHGRHDLETGHLVAEGRRQARAVARRLARVPFAVIHTSTLPRALETTEIVRERFPHLTPRRAHLLRECLPGVPMSAMRAVTGLTADEIRRRLARNAAFRRRTLRDAARKLGREPKELREGAAQVERVFDRYFKPARGAERHELLVCHGNLIRALLLRAFDVPIDGWLNALPDNAGVSVVHVRARDRVTVRSFNSPGSV